MTAPERVYLHIGLHKTGTTYLQNVLRANREGMRAQQVEFTGGPGEPVQAFAVWDLQGRRPRGAADRRIAGSWDALVEAVNACGLPSALISEERLSVSNLKQARKAVTSFSDSEVHVVVTVRDLGRVVVSAWQEEVKNDQTWTWEQFVAAVKDPEQRGRQPGAGVLAATGSVTRILQTWEASVPAERIHIITVPASGTPPDVLLERYASVVGFDASRLTEQPVWGNETVGVAATEVIRRLNDRFEGRLNQRAYDRVVKFTLVQMLAKRTEPVRFSLPPEELGWVTERAEALVAYVRTRGYPVTGDLDELRPRLREPARRPDDATESELLEASLDALALLAERYATTWWVRRAPDLDEQHSRTGDLASKARGVIFRGQRSAATLVDRSPAAAKALGLVMKVPRSDAWQGTQKGAGQGPLGRRCSPRPPAWATCREGRRASTGLSAMWPFPGGGAQTVSPRHHRLPEVVVAQAIRPLDQPAPRAATGRCR